MPPIVIDGKTANYKQLVTDLKTQIRGEFSLKHTYYTTIIFVENRGDYNSILATI